MYCSYSSFITNMMVTILVVFCCPKMDGHSAVTNVAAFVTSCWVITNETAFNANIFFSDIFFFTILLFLTNFFCTNMFVLLRQISLIPSDIVSTSFCLSFSSSSLILLTMYDMIALCPIFSVSSIMDSTSSN